MSLRPHGIYHLNRTRPDGADFEVIADDEVKECRTKSCIASMTKAQPAYDYKLGAYLIWFTPDFDEPSMQPAIQQTSRFLAVVTCARNHVPANSYVDVHIPKFSPASFSVATRAVVVLGDFYFLTFAQKLR